MFPINSGNIAGRSVHPELCLPRRTDRGQHTQNCACQEHTEDSTPVPVLVKENTQRKHMQNHACQEHTEESSLSDKERKIY